ncbi:hypothetical protein GCM10029978_091860 [Actinoallomurus acanthiterrae]
MSRHAPGVAALIDTAGSPALHLHRRRGDHAADRAALRRAEGLIDGWIGTVDSTRIVAAERAYIGAFFDEHLRHRPQRLLDGPSPRHPDVVFVR